MYTIDKYCRENIEMKSIMNPTCNQLESQNAMKCLSKSVYRSDHLLMLFVSSS